MHDNRARIEAASLLGKIDTNVTNFTVDLNELSRHDSFVLNALADRVHDDSRGVTVSRCHV
jgi:anti-anti-sigma regulatory factor